MLRLDFVSYNCDTYKNQLFYIFSLTKLKLELKNLEYRLNESNFNDGKITIEFHMLFRQENDNFEKENG